MTRIKVFISWSGELSKNIAFILKDWIPQVLHTVDPFVSSKDIIKGHTWFESITTELKNSDYGILCLTNDNTREPWLNFEAGALFSKFDVSRVCPFLYNIKPDEIDEPLKQLQVTLFSKEEVLSLMHTLNNLAKEFRDDKLKRAFETHWPDLHQHFTNINLEEIQSKSKESNALKEQLNGSSNIKQSKPHLNIDPKFYNGFELKDKMKMVSNEILYRILPKYKLINNFSMGFNYNPDQKLVLNFKNKTELEKITEEVVKEIQSLELSSGIKIEFIVLPDTDSYLGVEYNDKMRKITKEIQNLLLSKYGMNCPAGYSYINRDNKISVQVHEAKVIPEEAIKEFSNLESKYRVKIEI